MLRIDKTEHHRVNGTEPLEQYTINDNIVRFLPPCVSIADFVQVFSAYISKYDPETSGWTPYAGLGDLQLEFTMLDPHIRTALLPVPGVPGKYSVAFRAPDRHGVFKFVVDYKRKGWAFFLLTPHLELMTLERWTYLSSTSTVAVVPPRHDGYPRFVSAAWPYYTGAVSTSVAFFLFSAGWLGGGKGGKKKVE